MKPWWVAFAIGCGSPEPDAPTDGATADGMPDVPAGCELPALDAATPELAGWLTGLPAPRATIQQRNDARTFLLAELAGLGYTAETHQYNNGANVVATLPATMGAGKGIIVGAHFDTVSGSPGANDNASGTVAVLGVAKLLAGVSCRTAPVTIAFFDQEELGLFGARAYAMSIDPDTIAAVHTIDQVAWDEDGDRRFELEAGTATLNAEWTAAAGIVGVPVTKVPTEGTDHEAFRALGFAAIGLTEEFVGNDTSPHRHLATDTTDTADLPYLALATKLAAQVVISEISP